MTKSPLKWHGGKFYLAKRIVALMPPHLHYVEPFAGSLAVLLERDANRNWLGPECDSSCMGCSEVVNDLHGELINLWQVLANADQFVEFQRLATFTPFSEELFRRADLVVDHETSVERAVRFFVRCRQSMSGRLKDFAPLTRSRTRRGMNEQASAWLNCIEGLPEVHQRLQQVVILNRDAFDVIRQQDGERTLFYLDPPYLPETRATTGEYEHEMSVEQHKKLLELLATIQGKFMLSGYSSPLYDSMAAERGWRRVDFEAPNNAAGGEKKRRVIESVWMNYPEPQPLVAPTQDVLFAK